jgi:hypothetical protein
MTQSWRHHKGMSYFSKHAPVVYTYNPERFIPYDIIDRNKTLTLFEE